MTSSENNIKCIPDIYFWDLYEIVLDLAIGILAKSCSYYVIS